MAISIRKGPSKPACNRGPLIEAGLVVARRRRVRKARHRLAGQATRPAAWQLADSGLARAGCSGREPSHLAGGGAVSLLTAGDERQRAAPSRQRGSHLVCNMRRDGGSQLREGTFGR
jgi:hypothetical protein